MSNMLKRNFLKKYSPRLLAFWTLIVCALLGYNIYEHHRGSLREAANEARNYYELNLAYRTWASKAGGIYAPIDKIAPNPYLVVPNRDITTTDGRKLTLVNPAYMTRMVFEIVQTKFALPVGHKLTSTKYLNPQNAPSEWEQNALLSFEKGTTESVRVTTIENKPYLQLMKPFMTEESCLKCHSHQGYNVGDVRGGISIAIPLQPYYTAEARTVTIMSAAYLLLWIIGSVGLIMFSRQRDQQEQCYQTLFESANDAIFLILAGRMVICNKKTLDLFGYEREQVVGKTLDQLSPPLQEDGRNSKRKSDELLHAVIAGTPQRSDWLFVKANSELLYVELSLNEVEFASEVYIQAIVRDITERKRSEEEKILLEAQLFQSQKMEAIGHLAGGIAHDFNNLLTSIIGCGSLLDMKIEKGSELKHLVGQILSSAERSASLTRQLLAFSRKQIIAPKATDLNELIREMRNLILRLVGEDIELRIQLTDKDLIVMVDPSQIEQVLMNLCTNARDAMPDGGRLSICTEIVELDKGCKLLHDLDGSGTYAIISVTDTGMGMNKDTSEKIFNPFFTTKEVGKGTGLGLSIAYGIVKQHNGTIIVHSEPLKGTMFKIYLPLTTSPVEKTNAVASAILRGGTETILIAEDDRAVRDIIRISLERGGYKVIEATDGEEAIKTFTENKDKIQLVLLDVVMPKKNGKEVFDEIIKIEPLMKILFTSGYTADIVHRKGICDDSIDFIPKPVSPHNILLKVREVLDKGR